MDIQLYGTFNDGIHDRLIIYTNLFDKLNF